MIKNTLICFAVILCFYACNRAEKQTKKNAIASDSLKNLKPKEDTLSSVENPDSVVYSKFNNSIIEEEYKVLSLLNFQIYQLMINLSLPFLKEI